MRIILHKSLLTTQQTTYRFGALGNSGDKSAEEHGFPSGKGRKKPFSAESAIINAFGSIDGVRTVQKRKPPKALQPCGFRAVWEMIKGSQKCV